MHDGERPAVGIANVKGADQPVDSAGSDDSVSVLVPVVREDFGGRAAGRYGAGMAWWCMDGNGRGEVVFSGRGHSQVEYSEVRVGGGRRD